MKRIRVGVLGAYRGRSMLRYCANSIDKAEIVAVCDKNPHFIDDVRQDLNDDNITYYDNFEKFLEHDMDAVVLANYANEHAPFAIRCLNKGLHVYSEVLPCQNMAEAVALVEAVENSGKIYAYGENYCYMAGPREMRRLYKEGVIGEFEYGEGEYLHNCEPIWPEITYGERDHWRNHMYAAFYCTHSIGPLIHITGLRPVSVSGFEMKMNKRPIRNGALGAPYAVEMITLENGAIIKSIHGCFISTDSIWYSIYGEKGRMETAREDAELEGSERIYVNHMQADNDYPSRRRVSYVPMSDEKSATFGHGGSDFYSMDKFIDKINGIDTDTIDVYEALDMFLPGLLAHRSILNGGAPVEIPNLRNKQERDLYRNDVSCVDNKVANDSLLASTKDGTPNIPDETYDEIKNKWNVIKERAEQEHQKKIQEGNNKI